MDRRYFKTGLLLAALIGMSQKAEAQKKNDFNNPALTHYFNEQHSRYISFSGYAELWARYTQLNPGSMVNNDAKSDLSDLSLRRVRVKMTYKPTEKLMFVLHREEPPMLMSMPKAATISTCWMPMQNMHLMIKLLSGQGVLHGEAFPGLQQAR
ncbi:hypothetical protein [Chryseobacterium sp. SORGH_AS_1048]|uniref:hypothetical protein n=1 Tax=Chryseobacterium sp. SORGH_AS_1048 TaxID=3041783 RepID=UPI0027D7F557|nr:hypothetical protein [Chryseobacterium sp. SORGH_AS_1048]